MKTGIIKNFNLIENSVFEFNRFNRKFDFAIAESVFPYISLVQIENCLKQLRPTMNSEESLFSTYTIEVHPTASFMFAGTHVRGKPLD